MKWFEKIADKLSWLAIPNLTLILVAGSGTFFIIGSFQPEILPALLLTPSKVWQGEVWRVATFLFYPLDMHPIFAFFTYYIFYIMGTALEAEWGEAKFTLYVLIECVLTVVFLLVFPFTAATNSFIFGSIFLAFAFLFPEFTLYLFFIIPIKVKYIAALTWLFFLLILVQGTWGLRIMILIAVGNFLLFFGKTIFDNMRSHRRGMAFKAHKIREDKIPFHVCHACKITEKKDPNMDFRVCPSCKGLEYCKTHMKDHAHILT